KRHYAVADKNCRCFVSPAKQLLAEPVAGFIAKIALQDKGRINLDVRLMQRFLISGKALARYLSIQLSRDDRDFSVPELDKMAHALVASAYIVQQYRIRRYS